MKFEVDFGLDWCQTLLIPVSGRGHQTEFALDGVLVCIRY